MPVSYTHLDVYKRQILLESSFTLTRSQNAAFIEGKDMDGRLSLPCPISRRHLPLLTQLIRLTSVQSKLFMALTTNQLRPANTNVFFPP